MAYWLMKTEPATYSYEDLVQEGATWWDGVRNYQARNHMRTMEVGDHVFIYHSMSDKAVVGLAEVRHAAKQDPTTDDPRWSVVEVVPLCGFSHPVTLPMIKADPLLSTMPLVRQSRLSVMPIAEDCAEQVLLLGTGQGF